ncbi:protein-L-isoaspartate(D-aspartate) O-methyltransferase [Phlebotomus argentipes]|uniref:protein-L-isoaspartate(D-aspartate) O-methyltransferase n=1 Tax=Phlebotomus argentipes TaxID=94469 RepID=UPI002892B116|nr:protein-L-isoaspartate(D-aspartate) O-methyltransferase [Phlebotomus argentipes]
MAWRSVGKDNADLVRKLREFNIISKDAVENAMKDTDRKFYCPNNSYMDAPQTIGCGVTISAPHMHAYALELLSNHVRPGSRVLDVGSGSGYLTACFARYLKAQADLGSGLVVGIEHQPKLVELSLKNIRSDDASLLESGVIKIVEGDGRLGCPEHAPYDAIHVGAAAPETPTELITQLNNGGRLVVPVGPALGSQYLEQYDKDASGTVTKTRLMGVMYVPLTDLKTP